MNKIYNDHLSVFVLNHTESRPVRIISVKTETDFKSFLRVSGLSIFLVQMSLNWAKNVLKWSEFRFSFNRVENVMSKGLTR